MKKFAKKLQFLKVIIVSIILNVTFIYMCVVHLFVKLITANCLHIVVLACIDK